MNHLYTRMIAPVLTLSCAFLLSGCGGENSDGSDATTYSSCSITDSAAAFAGDRSKDVSQCWDGADYEEKSLALDWCEQKVSDYIASEYVLGHQVEFRVASTNCLNTTSQAPSSDDLIDDRGADQPEPDSEGEDLNTDPDDSDSGSEPDAWAYRSCSIKTSDALFESDRIVDESQCWNGGTEQDQNLAMDWCRQKVTQYIDDRYFFGHSVTYSVSTAECSS